MLARIFALSGLLCLAACSKEAKHGSALTDIERQTQKQGYPVLIATPQVANYELPFCEHRYCIEIEIHGLESSDAWFNQTTEHLMSELIRKQLQLTQRLTLQQAVDAFIKHSDLWQQAKQGAKPWSLSMSAQVVMQHKQFTLLQLRSQYQIKAEDLAEEDHFFMLDRKQQKIISLYELIKPKARLEFGQYIQHQFQQWKATLSPAQQKTLPLKLYWASQDWYLDEQELVIYYRASDLGLQSTQGFQLRLSPAQIDQYLEAEIIQQLALQ